MGAKASSVGLPPQSIKELQQHVDFTPEEIKTWYYEYKASLCPGQKELTKDEFKKVYNSLFAGDASDFAEQVFRTFDTDGNWTVDFKEFIVGLCVSGSTGFNAKLTWAFQMYDLNGDGFISWDEMRHMISAIYKMTQAIVPQELSTPRKMTDKLFNMFDLNRDGWISYEEFYQGASKDPVILQLLECDPFGSDSPTTPSKSKLFKF